MCTTSSLRSFYITPHVYTNPEFGSEEAKMNKVWRDATRPLISIETDVSAYE